jgi:nicotinate-nucleotide pyrophosphorylase (carboxylating)
MEKAAVKAGGGTNHRMGLFDMVLIKDNHLAIWDTPDEAKAVEQAVARARATAPAGLQIQVEVTTLDAALKAGHCGAHMILLDNMSSDEMTEVMKALDSAFGESRPKVEASGGITLANIKEVAASGVDRISIGALTHSPPALDIAMYIGFD